MARFPKEWLLGVELRSGAAQGTALTTNDTDILATDLKDVKLQDCLAGIGIITIEAITAADETYQIDVIGRSDDTDTYEVLGTWTGDTAAGTATVGVKMFDIDHFRGQLNYRITVTGSTPSITFGLMCVSTKTRYGRTGGRVLTS